MGVAPSLMLGSSPCLGQDVVSCAVLEDPLEGLPRSSPRIGVALGGGSARGYAHIGALAALDRRGLSPSVVVGTSFGAFVGALYAAGTSPAQMRADAEKTRRRDVIPEIFDFNPLRGALCAGDRLEAYFARWVGDRTIESLPLKFAVVTTDVDTGERVVLDRGPLARALRASASLPGIFAPVEWEGRRLLDGGIGTPVPLDTLDGFDVDVALGVGAGVEVRDSQALYLMRSVVKSQAGRQVRSWLGQSPGSPTPWATFGRALAVTMDAWGSLGDSLPEGEGRAFHVQTRPPIHWLRFDRAALAIAAGDAAMERAWPRLGARLLSRQGDRLGRESQA